MSVFKDYSNYYDLLYNDKDYASEVEYIHSLIQAECPKAKTILNLGCGTGKHDFLLAQKGYNITAVDLSSTMIDIAKKNNESDHIEFSIGDIRSLKLDSKFDVVISMFHVMSYQVEDADLNAAFSTAKTHLKEDGVFIFDCWNATGVLSDPPHKRVKNVENENMKIHRKTTPISLPEKNCVDVIFDIEISNKETDESFEISETHRMRYLFPEELQTAGKNAGLQMAKSYKWLTTKTPEHSDWYSLYIFR